MTRVRTHGRVGSVSEHPSRHSERKATLFCPRCGHESPVDGDWELTIRPSVVDLHCPECREHLTRRPHGWETAKERSERDQ